MKLLVPPQSGSLAGQTASHNRYGQYLRTRAIPVNPNTTRQTAIRALLSSAASSWATLTEARKEAWVSYAQEHPRVDPLGQSYTMTGFGMYVSTYVALTSSGLAIVSDAPAGADPAAPTLYGIVIDDSPSAAIAFIPSPVPADSVLVVHVSPPVSVGVSFQKDLRFAKAIPAAAASAQQIEDEIVAMYGTIITGNRYFARAKIVQENGLQSAWSNVVFGDVTS